MIQKNFFELSTGGLVDITLIAALIPEAGDPLLKAPYYELVFVGWSTTISKTDGDDLVARIKKEAGQ